jgi:glycosyltransferase involved in cell wall biosynthesis
MPTRLVADLVTISQLTKTKKTPVILHYRLYQEFNSIFTRIISKLHYSTLGHVTFHHAKKIVVPNVFYKELLQELFGISIDKICVVPNAVDTEVYDPAKIDMKRAREKYDADGKRVILFAGRLIDHKGIEYLIRAFQRVTLERIHDCNLLIAGNGPLEASLRSLVNKLELKKFVRFLGAVPQVLMPELLSAADIFVLPSLFECSSNVLREALAMEKPVISTIAGDASIVITHEKNGILVPPRRIEELADAMLYLLGNQKTAAQLGYAGRKAILERYSWNTAVQKILRIYSEVLPDKQ